MRLNRFIALATGLSRRKVDQAIDDKRVLLNGSTAKLGQVAKKGDEVTLDGKVLKPPATTTSIMFHKPAGFVCSRAGQGSKTIYDLMPKELHKLKPVGRLDKDSTGLLLMTDDGELAHYLTHPSFKKLKVYDITLDEPLQKLHQQMISDFGVELEDGLSKLMLERIEEYDDHSWRVSMHEGRNRQIRRTFAGLGYNVTRLHRIRFGSYKLPDDLRVGEYIEI
jgi:23S rRNA pseudouridine2605 synthase